MLRWTRGTFVAAVGVLCVVAAPARAQVLYGITLNDQLITINTTTGAGTIVGPLSSSMNSPGLGFRGTKLYAWDDNAQVLRQLDPATGTTLNTINIGAAALGGDVTFRGDGIGFLSPGMPASQLISFDITVPSSSIVGPLNPQMYGLAVSAGNVLFGLSQNGGGLYTINQATGVTTLVGNTGLPVLPVGGMAFDPVNGQPYAALGPVAGPSSLYRIDPSTGAPTLVGSIGINAVSGIAFQPVPPPPPTPPAAGAGEGSFAGVADPPPFGNEGSFGPHAGIQFASAALPGQAPPPPALLGPFLQGSGAGQGRTKVSPAFAAAPPAGTSLRVLNVAHRHLARGGDGASAELEGDRDLPAWTLVCCLALVAIAVVAGRALLRSQPPPGR